MIKYFVILFTLISFLNLSCGEDRTYEYENLTQHNIWMYEVMLDKYLWNDNLPEQTWKSYFATPVDYFSSLTAKGDNDDWSYIEVDTVSTDNHQRGYFNHSDSYGFDFVLMTDPTGATTRSYARVVSIWKDSPAYRAGLRRNDYIQLFDGYKLSKSNISRLENGISHTLTVSRLIIDAEQSVFEWEDVRTLQLGASEYVEDIAFPITNVISQAGLNIGYVMCNRLTETAIEQSRSSSDYKADMDDAFSMLKSNDIDELILDLRLCNFGTMDMARRLASYIVPDEALDSVFAKTFWNEANDVNNETIYFDSSLKGRNLGMNRVYVITSSYTQGAAEWVISALNYVLGKDNVILVGTTTNGQNVMTQHVGDYEDMIHIYPSVAYVSNGSADYSTYKNGFTPDVNIDEFEYMELYDYGSLYEVLFLTTLEMILGYEE